MIAVPIAGSSDVIDGNDQHATLMRALARKHALLADLIGRRRLHYVDIPVHGNIGDLLIMHGTLAFFQKQNLVPQIIAPYFAYRPEWIGPNDVVVFHGGGNFGDLYRGMHTFRERVVSAKPGNRIIILPQTIHFSSGLERQRSATIFRAHPDLHVCVRDKASYELALDFTDHVYLLPDMAHQLYPINPVHAAIQQGKLFISRTDDEKSNIKEVAADLGITRIADWPELVGDRQSSLRWFYLALRVMYRAQLGWPANKVFSGFWADYSGKLIAQGIALFSDYGHVVTDRLHGHILACLMDKPSTVLDNSYGKNSGYVRSWTLSSGLVELRLMTQT